eukprot:496360_1
MSAVLSNSDERSFVISIAPEIAHSGLPNRADHKRKKAIPNLCKARRFYHIIKKVSTEMNTLQEYNEETHEIYLYGLLQPEGDDIPDSISIRNSSELEENLDYISVETTGKYENFIILSAWFSKKQKTKRSLVENISRYHRRRLNNGNVQNIITTNNSNNNNSYSPTIDPTQITRKLRPGRLAIDTIIDILENCSSSEKIQRINETMKPVILDKLLVTLYNCTVTMGKKHILDFHITNCPCCSKSRKLMYIGDISPLLRHFKKECTDDRSELMLNRHNSLVKDGKTIVYINSQWPLPPEFSEAHSHQTWLKQFLAQLTDENPTITINKNTMQWGYINFIQKKLNKTWWKKLHQDTQKKAKLHYSSLINTNQTTSTALSIQTTQNIISIQENNVSECKSNDNGIMLQNQTHITKNDANSVLLSTPSEYTITVVYITINGKLLMIIRPKIWHQNEYPHSNNICGATAPITAKISNTFLKEIIQGGEYINNLIFNDNNVISELNDISEPNDDETQKVMNFEKVLESFNDASAIRSELVKIKQQIETYALNPLNTRITHALQLLDITAVEKIVENNSLFTSFNILILSNAHQIKNSLLDGVFPEDLDDNLFELSFQLNDSKTTDPFIIQNSHHYFTAILHQFNDEKYMFFNTDTLNPQIDVLRNEHSRPFRVIFNLITHYDDINRQNIEALSLLQKVQDRIKRLRLNSFEMINLFAKIFQQVINFKELPNTYYEPDNNDVNTALTALAAQIYNDLESRSDLILSTLQTTDINLHKSNLKIYLQSLDGETFTDLFDAIKKHELTMTQNNSAANIKDIVNYFEEQVDWALNISNTIHCYHTFTKTLNSESTWTDVQNVLTTLNTNIDQISQELYESLFLSYGQVQLYEIACEECTCIIEEYCEAD